MRRLAGIRPPPLDHIMGVSVEDIIRKITLYFENDQGRHNDSQSLQEKIFIFLRKLCDCELWLVKEFGVKEFKSLGHGEFFMFLEKYACLLPHELCKFLTGDVTGKCPLEVCLPQHHLVVLVSQALNSLWEDESVTKEKILLLLRKQFPLVSFTTIENGSVEDFLSIVGKHKNAAISKCVLFSMALCGTSNARQSSAQIENVLWNSTLINTDSGQKAKPYESVTSKDAIEVLLRAPMMSDLNLWSHWDLLFAPSLGPLLPWLLKEVNTDELLCLVTRDGKLIRLDHSATVDSFLEAALQGSSFQTAVKMLSLFSLVGGEKHVPVSLLKIHIQHAFEVILKNYLDGLEVHDNNNSFNYGEPLSRQEIVGEVAAGKLCSKLHSDLSKMNSATPVISRFVLECLGYLPTEFRDFSADILLSGIQSVVKHAPSAILGECIKSEQRLMLHEVGLSLGIVEWITDYYEFCSNDATDLSISADSRKFSASEQSMGASGRSDEQIRGCTGICMKIDSAEASDARNGYCSTQSSAELNKHEDAAQVIESIRRDEFGLDSSLQSVESIMLKKQHARLGRALHCLSQELYSQDSHFLLELVQNADDNTYPTNVEPTLTFILQESSIIVLNNEQGFSSQNIRALCDVGSSTKKGSNAGYIGQKGIGFKSVFRVTDAPEIHSNGFHIKFDISEGQIGFVLPTVVPPCSIDLFSRLTSGGSDQSDCDCWNTCIVLPFKSKLSDATVMKNIINMFSDLHPSLLLFLHRLQCIKFRNLLDDSLTVMRKEIVGDGIVKVSHGKEKMTWYVVSQKLQAEFVRSDVQKTEISIALTLKESDSGDYSPDLRQHPGDFAITSSREEVDGDSPWNQWLLSEFPERIQAELWQLICPLFRLSGSSSVEASFDSRIQMDVIENLRKIPFIPFSDGTYGAIDEGPIWLHFDASCTELEAQHGLESFPHLYAKLRTVNPALLSTLSADMSSMDVTTVEKLTCMLFRIGVQKLSTHEIVKVHILPAMSEDRIMDRDKNLMIEYLCFVMLHLQSSCSDCHVEREYIISEILDKAYISTNHGFKRPSEVSIHFSQEFGNPVDIKKLINMVDMKWHEVDISYLRHPVAKSLPCELEKWRQFFQQIGIMDFVKVVQVEKGIADISDGVVKNLIWDKDLISLRPNITDWESPELVDLLSVLARDGNKRGCEYLLEVLDTLWDDCYSEKTTGYCASNSEADRRPFKSSFISSICDVQWVASAMDDVLHYPKHLYHDCDAVRLTLGASAPFAIPKVRSENFVRDIGFKTIVSLDDALEVLKLWRRENEFQARHEDVVSGTLLSPAEVYWHDSTSFVDQIREIHRQCSSAGVAHGPLIKTLCNFYPGLHDFFVDVCGVHETPPLRSYIQILLHLSNVALPSQAASAVFQVFLKWTDGLKSGLSAEDVLYLKDLLTKIECTVLPTLQDKWVSLHPSFGLVCWCDDKKLSKQFKHLDGIDFLYLGELSKDDEEMLCTKVSILMQTLGIPALSEVVTREAIYSGIEDSSFKAALLDWALPYAQRYLNGVHPDKYSQLKQSEFLNRLQVVVVEKLFYRNVIKGTGSESKKQVECSCLLTGSILYTTQESDSHALFLELSRLFFNGSPELHFANFLHMITTMAESGSNEEQTEFFILNSQKVPKLPDGESVWSLSSVHSLTRSDKPLQTSSISTEVNEQSSSKSKSKAATWPPVDWKTAPGFGYARANGFKTQAPGSQPNTAVQSKLGDDSEGISRQTDNLTPVSVDTNWTIEHCSATSAALVLPDSNRLQKHCSEADNEADLSMHIQFDPSSFGPVSDAPDFGSSNFSKRDQLRFGTPNSTQAILTGRLGELVAFKYFVDKAGKSVVKWVNEHNETGLPYDIVLGEKENSREYIEVKATKSTRKDWFEISMRELQFAVEKGEAFSIAHVVLLDNNVARVSVFNNLAKLCQLHKLRLAVLMPEQQKEFSIVSQS
ncbi:unnamed protein product [Malus baccata var. baccata]